MSIIDDDVMVFLLCPRCETKIKKPVLQNIRCPVCGLHIKGVDTP